MTLPELNIEIVTLQTQRSRLVIEHTVTTGAEHAAAWKALLSTDRKIAHRIRKRTELRAEMNATGRPYLGDHRRS